MTEIDLITMANQVKKTISIRMNSIQRGRDIHVAVTEGRNNRNNEEEFTEIYAWGSKI